MTIQVPEVSVFGIYLFLLFLSILRYGPGAISIGYLVALFSVSIGIAHALSLESGEFIPTIRSMLTMARVFLDTIEKAIDILHALRW